MTYTSQQLKQAKKFKVIIFMLLTGVRTIPQEIASWTFWFNSNEKQLYISVDSDKVKVLNQDEVLYKLCNKHFKDKNIPVKCENNINLILSGKYKQIELIN